MYSSQIGHYLNPSCPMLGTKKGCCGLTQQAVKPYTTSHTPHAREGFWRQLGERSKIFGMRKTQFKRTEKEGGNINNNNNRIRLHKISDIQHNCSTPAEQRSDRQFISSGPQPSFSLVYTEPDVMWYGAFLWSAEATCPICVSSQFLVAPSLLTNGMWCKKLRSPWLCINSAYQQL